MRHRHFLAALQAERELRTYFEAVKDGRWRKAMQHEIDALENNNVWIVENLPKRNKALGCK